MKYLAGLMLLMLAQVASASLCSVNYGYWKDPGTNEFNVHVDLMADVAQGIIKPVELDIYCQHDRTPLQGHALELKTYSDSITFAPEFSHLKGGLLTEHTKYFAPITTNILIGAQRNDSIYARVKGGIFFSLNQAASAGHVVIGKNKKIVTLLLRAQSWNYSTVIKNASLKVNIYARDTFSLNPATCTINNNNPIVVDFGLVNPLAISGDIPSGTPYRQSVELNYSCPNSGIDSFIDVKLQGATSLFNTNALKTDNDNLAVAMIRLSSLVAPGSSFRTKITNSSGRDTVLFTLFRKGGSLPAAGLFRASGTLVMSVP